jgi:acylphosphatase
VKIVKKRVHVLISGMVQGVWYRASTKDKADEFGITGWVRNTPDGKVEAVFEGEENNIRRMLSWCWDGPEMAKVVDVNISFEDFIDEFDNFKIVH